MNAIKRFKDKLKNISIPMDEVFTSPCLLSYLRTLLSVPCSRIKVSVPGLAFLQKGDDSIAYTDHSKIFLNPCHKAVEEWCESDRVKKLSVLIGILLHEYGHIRFTDAEAHLKAVNAIEQKGELFPKVREDANPELYETQRDVEIFLEEHKETRPTCANIWHDLWNCLEDGYIEEALYLSDISGILIDGLNFARYCQRKHTQPLSEMLKRAPETEDPAELASFNYSVARNLILSYVKYGTIKCDFDNDDEMNSEAMNWFNTVRKDVARSLKKWRGTDRLDATNVVFLKLWPLISLFLEKKASEASSSEYSPDVSDGDGSGSISSSIPHAAPPSAPKKTISKPEGMDDSEKTEADKCRDDVDEKMDDAFGSDDDSDESSDETKDSAEDSGKDSDADKDDSSDSGDEGSDSGESGSSSEKDETTTEEPDIDLEALERAMESVHKEMLTEAAEDAVNEDIESEIAEDTAKALKSCSMHKDIAKRIIRIGRPSPAMKELYAKTCGETETIAKTMARKIAKELKKKQSDERLPLTGLISGTKFDATRLVNNDYRYFKKNEMPAIDKSMALCILVDESGSMGFGPRMASARSAALALYLFARECNIPCAVVGHSEQFNGAKAMELRSYADYDNPDKEDKYRILNLQRRENNRDGAAILSCGQRLISRQERTKMMIVISDGAPLAEAYSGPSARDDTKASVATLRKNGVIVFGAAIGDDKEDVHQIYGNGFIDITNLSTMPEQLLQLVKRFVR